MSRNMKSGRSKALNQSNALNMLMTFLARSEGFELKS